MYYQHCWLNSSHNGFLTAPQNWQVCYQLRTSAPARPSSWNPCPSEQPPDSFPHHFQIPAHCHLLSEPSPDHSYTPLKTFVFSKLLDPALVWVWHLTLFYNVLYCILSYCAMVYYIFTWKIALSYKCKLSAYKDVLISLFTSLSPRSNIQQVFNEYLMN